MFLRAPVTVDKWELVWVEYEMLTLGPVEEAENHIGGV